MIHGLPPPSASYEKYFFVQSQLALRGGPGNKKRNVLHQSIPIHYKTTGWKKKSIRCKEELQCYFFVQVYMYNPLYILYFDMYISFFMFHLWPAIGKHGLDRRCTLTRAEKKKNIMMVIKANIFKKRGSYGILRL